MRRTKLYNAILLLMLSPSFCYCQQADSSFQNDIAFTFKNDTLFSNKGFEIFVGKRLVAGKGSGEDGQYQTISFARPYAFPLMFLRNSEIENDPDYKLDPSERDRDKVKETLSPGETLIVKKIRLYGKKKKWRYYKVTFWDGTSKWSNKFSCNMLLALKLHEILIE